MSANTMADAGMLEKLPPEVRTMIYELALTTPEGLKLEQ